MPLHAPLGWRLKGVHPCPGALGSTFLRMAFNVINMFECIVGPGAKVNTIWAPGTQ